MSSMSDIDKAVRNVRQTFDRVADEAGSLTEEAKQEVRDAIDEVEAEIKAFRNK